MWVGSQIMLILLLTIMLPAAQLMLPEMHSVSPLDDHSDPLWLDRASHRGTEEAEKDIAQAEAESRGANNIIIQSDQEARQSTVRKANIEYNKAKDVFTVASQKRKKLERAAGLLDVSKDEIGDELIMDQATTAADEAAAEDVRRSGQLRPNDVLFSRMRNDDDVAKTERMQFAFLHAQQKHHRADDHAWTAAENEHRAHLKLTAARQARDVATDIFRATVLDQQQAHDAEQRANSDLTDAKQRAAERAQKHVAPEYHGSPGYIVEGSHLYQARFSPAPPPPVVALDKVERGASSVLETMKKVDQKDNEWVYDTAEQHGLRPLETVKHGLEKPVEDQLGESLHETPTVFKFSTGNAIRAVDEVSNIAKKMSNSAQKTIVAASGSDGTVGDDALLKSLNVLSNMREAALKATKVAHDVAESDLMLRRAKGAVDDVVNPTGARAQAKECEGCDAAVKHITAAHTKMHSMQEEIDKLKAAVKQQQAAGILAKKELAVLRTKCGPYAAEHVADHWMKQQEKKSRDEAFTFDSAVMQATQKSQQKAFQKVTTATWANVMDRASQANTDLTEATISEHSSIKMYETTAVATADAEQRLKMFSKMVQYSKRRFKKFGPKQTDDQIAASMQAKRQNEKREDAFSKYRESVREEKMGARMSQTALLKERDASLKMLKAFREKSAALKVYSDERVAIAHARCAAEKALGGQCHDVEKLLELHVQKNDCTNFTKWKTVIQKSAIHIDMLKFKQKYEVEHGRLLRCAGQYRAPTKSLSKKASIHTDGIDATNRTNATNVTTPTNNYELLF